MKMSDVSELPYTISYVIRKRTQIDSFRELPKEKRPVEKMMWEGTSEELEDWFDKIYNKKTKNNPASPGLIMEIDKKLVEG